jgi:hypothetical protein
VPAWVHPTPGTGRVMQLRDDEGMPIASVDFDTGDRKSLMLEYALPIPLAVHPGDGRDRTPPVTADAAQRACTWRPRRQQRDLDIVTDATAEVRVHGLPPVFKLYLINGREAFFGFYPITEHTVRAGGGVHPMYDLMGKDSILFHHCGDDAEQGSTQRHAGAFCDVRYRGGSSSAHP